MDSVNIQLDTLGERLTYIIDKKLHTTRVDFASTIDVQESSVRAWCKNRRGPNQAAFSAMNKEYNININYLVAGDLPIFIPRPENHQELSERIPGILVPMDINLGELRYKADQCADFVIARRLEELDPGEALDPKEVKNIVLDSFQDCLESQRS